MHIEKPNEGLSRLQVNGRDVSGSSHEDAVEAFRTAKEPIVVEVLRKVGGKHSSKMKSKPPPIPMVTVATQTDDYIENDFFSMLAENPSMEFYLNGNRWVIN